MTFNQNELFELIRLKSDRPMKLRDLCQKLDIPDDDYPDFRRKVKSMVASGKLVKLREGKIGIASQMNILTGKLAMTRSGTGFLIQEKEGTEDVLIPPENLLTAMDGDQIMVRLEGRVRGRQTGAVIRVVERTKRNIVGTFKTGRSFCHVVPDNPKIHRDIYIPPSETNDALDGEKVVAVLKCWDDPHLNPEGIITERIGKPGKPGVDMLTIIKSYGFPETFPDEVLNEAEQAAVMPELDQLPDRLNLTRDCIYTIDPDDAKDHDDAVSVERISSGYRLGVHIADVSWFIKEDGALDAEALLRGNSVYLPGIVVPMIPEVLSNDVCSLRVNRKRLAFSIFIDFDKKGKMLKWKLADSVIKSVAKLSYEQVQEFFDTSMVSPRIEKVAENLTIARELSQLLAKRRATEGSLDFDLPEAKIVLDKDGKVIELGSRVRLEAHRLVEEFMLAANKAVALEVLRQGQPFIYRVHDRPDMEKLEAFSSLMSQLGLKFPVSPEMKPAQFARFLEKIKDLPAADFINEVLLRSMKKAVYQRKNLGHFGLAFKHYTHFTSPIRRYADLLVHRLLRKLVRGKYPHPFSRKVPGLIDRVSAHCSETERMAESAEREAVRAKQVSFMTRLVGQSLDGVITGVTGHGFYVRLVEYGAEGMVRISSLDDDYYRYDEKRHQTVGSRHGKVFRLGDKVKVIVEKVDCQLREITLVVDKAGSLRVKKSHPKKSLKGKDRFGRTPNKKKQGRRRK